MAIKVQSNLFSVKQSGPSGPEVKVLARTVRDVGLSPTWLQLFSVRDVMTKLKFIPILLIP